MVGSLFMMACARVLSAVNKAHDPRLPQLRYALYRTG